MGGSKPLTFCELKVGSCFIFFPCDGDDAGHGGYRGAHRVFMKLNSNKAYSGGDENSIAVGSQVKSSMTPYMQVMKVLI